MLIMPDILTTLLTLYIQTYIFLEPPCQLIDAEHLMLNCLGSPIIDDMIITLDN